MSDGSNISPRFYIIQICVT